MDKQLFERVSKKIDGYRNEAIELQKLLISIPAIGPKSGGEGEMKKYLAVEPLLKKVSDEIITMHAPDESVPSKLRPNAIVKIKGKNDKLTLWMMSHLDVVPSGDEKNWKTNPFEAVVEGDKITGRGAEDNHHGLCASYFTMKAIKESGITPPTNICMLLIADEESENNCGIIYLLQNKKDIFGKNDLFLVPDTGDSEGKTIEVAEKRVLWLKFTTIGKQSHAAFPHQGINACRASAYLTTEIDKLREKYSAKLELFDPPQTTIEPTKKLANVPNVNTLPPEDIQYFDCRVLPDVDKDKFLSDINAICRKIEDRFSVKVSMNIEMSMEPSYTSPDSAVVNKLRTAIKQVYSLDAKVIGVGGATVAGYLRQAGFQAACSGKIDDVCHQPNEYTFISNILGDAKVFAHVALQE